MGFGLPLGLLAMALVGVPFALHLMRRRDLRVVTLPTLALLRQVKADTRRKLQTTDRILLALRTLIIACLALSIARPFVQTAVADGDGEVVALALVIDDSMSMGAEGASGTLLAEALDNAGDAIDALPEGSEVAVVLAGTPVRVLVARTRELAVARAVVEQSVVPTASGSRLGEAAAAAARELSGTSLARRVLVISDFREHAVRGVEWPRAQGIDWATARVEPTRTTNRGISDVVVTPSPSGDGTIVRVSVQGDPGEAVVQAYAGGLVVAEQPIVIEASMGAAGADRVDEATDTAALAGRDRGAAVARISLDAQGSTNGADAEGQSAPDGLIELRLAPNAADALDADDHVLARRSPRARHRILLLNGGPNSNPQLDELTFLRAALDAQRVELGLPEIQVGGAEVPNASTLRDAHIIVMANCPAPGRAAVARLRGFVDAGGALMVSVGDNVSPREAAAAYGDLLPGRLETAILTPEAETPVAWTGVGTLPDLPGANTRTFTPIVESPEATAMWRIGAATVAAGQAKGRGRVMLLGSTLDVAWGRLPLTPAFLGFVRHSVQWLNRGRAHGGARVVAGRAARLPQDAGVEVVLPDGTLVQASGSFANTRLAGAYGVRVEGRLEPSAGFIVAPDASESDLTPGEVPILGVAPGAGASRPTSRPLQAPLAPWLLLVAGLLFGAEGVVRTTAGRASS